MTEFNRQSWDESFSAQDQTRAAAALEQGQVLFFPQLPFDMVGAEQRYLIPDFIDAKHKNICYNPKSKELRNTATPSIDHPDLAVMMQRFSDHARELVEGLLPKYTGFLEQARTSYRPVQVAGRPSSYRKDDSRLHVDAFPSSPIKGKRILRVFSNVNPNNEPRVWRLGAPFNEVAAKFLPNIRKPFLFEAELLHAVGATKTKRSAYDHYMTQIHNRMKADVDYQKNVPQTEFHFPPGSTWMVFTDMASHAAMSGQFLLEQSFYLPVDAMSCPELAPLNILEQALARPLL